MSESFPDWKTAHRYAVGLARKLGREVGIERTRWFGKETFVVHTLPKPENRQGFELRLEIVKPDDPL